MSRGQLPGVSLQVQRVILTDEPQGEAAGISVRGEPILALSLSMPWVNVAGLQRETA